MPVKHLLARVLLLPLLCLCLPAPGVVAAGEPGEGKILSLREALIQGIRHNLELSMVEVRVPQSRLAETIQEARFDPVLEARGGVSSQKLPSASAFAVDNLERLDTSLASAGVRKTFETGLESKLALKTSSVDSNSPLITGVNPYYRNYIELDLTQPVLRNAGFEVNTAALRMAQNHGGQSQYTLLEQTHQLVEKIELTYYDLAQAREVLVQRRRSLALAQELWSANQQRFKAGMVPVTEVQQAESAMASREEQVVAAGQQMETISNRLKDLLELTPSGGGWPGPLVTDPLPEQQSPQPSPGEALERASRQRPDLLRQRLELENLDVRVAYLDNQRLPRLDLEGSLALNGFSGTNRGGNAPGTVTNSPYDGPYGAAWQDAMTGEGYEGYVGIRLSYPLGNRAADAGWQQAQWQKKRAIYQLKRLEGLTETEINNALVDMERSRERLAVARRLEGLAQTTLDQEMQRLAEGLSDTFHILDFQDKVVEAHVRAAAALADLDRAQARLMRAQGDNLTRFAIMPRLPKQPDKPTS
jgi:outer membrane protein TolC